MANLTIRCKGESAEVLIYDDIGGGMFGGGISAAEFSSELKAAKDAKSINVRINSAGGDVFEALGIYNALARHNARVTVDVDGIALSAASFIMMAGDEIRAAENAMIMVHDPWMVAMGNAEEFRKKVDLLDQVKGQLVGIYASRTGLPEDDISELLANETWMTAAEAVEAGFVGEVTGNKAMAASSKLTWSKFSAPEPGLLVQAHEVDGVLTDSKGQAWRRNLAKRRLDMIEQGL